MVKSIQRILYIILACFLGLFMASSFFIRAKYNYAVYGDTTVLENQQPLLFIALIAAVLGVSLLLYRLCLKLNKYSRRIVIPAVLLFSAAIQLVIIFLFTRMPTDDSQTVLSLAWDMLYNKDYSSFQSGGYLYMFPFNFSIVLYLKTLLLLFPDNYLVIKAFNILFSLVTTLMIYLLYKELNTRSRTPDYGVLIFAATFVPALFMSNFIYNDVIATALLTSALYFAVKFIRRKSMKDILFAAILLALGNYFRSTGTIFLIAVVLCLLFNLRSLGVKKAVASIGITLLLFAIPGWTQNALLQATGIVDESPSSNSAPVYMWLNMGINLETLGFWDNRESYNIYQQDAGYNQAESVELFKASIRNKLSSASAGELAGMYYKKLIWTWTEGTYQFERYGLGNDGDSIRSGRSGFVMDRYIYSTSASKLFKGASTYRSGLIWIVYVQNFLMYGFILFRLVTGIRAGRFGETSLILVLLGFIGFYLLWEIKVRYLYPVYPLLIILSALGFKDAYELVTAKGGIRHAAESAE
ncbi:glycosyltransferase family 39 protein [Paenibacillus sp. MMS20-IR301]|uniref:ArnT family glycosyltransferase n=1 Tax=Paenibacillus sp. MMS20-IR301 TaxID=2895946 RepID=UPI0028EF5825|nr:glycosyltransferase family 39 protein [Paenibacillus sp. MMS20-IR301]WNS41468.1 glycosyltransferase family 39 protein [Paenibacillus sp. MMS20-IR301]